MSKHSKAGWPVDCKPLARVKLLNRWLKPDNNGSATTGILASYTVAKLKEAFAFSSVPVLGFFPLLDKFLFCHTQSMITKIMALLLSLLSGAISIQLKAEHDDEIRTAVYRHDHLQSCGWFSSLWGCKRERELSSDFDYSILAADTFRPEWILARQYVVPAVLREFPTCFVADILRVVNADDSARYAGRNQIASRVGSRIRRNFFERHSAGFRRLTLGFTRVSSAIRRECRQLVFSARIALRRTGRGISEVETFARFWLS